MHGNSRKKETDEDGGKDENVFDIMTGVSIFFGIKKTNSKNKKLATVYKSDIYGKREQKFEFLHTQDLQSIDWVELPESCDIWKLEAEGKKEYDKGFSVAEVFPKNTTGIVTMGDSFIIDENKDTLEKRVDDFLNRDITEIELKTKYDLGKNYAKWIIENKNKIENNRDKLIKLAYRPFDFRYTYFDNNLVWRPRTEIMQNFVNKENLGLLSTKAVQDQSYNHIFITDSISEAIFLSGTTGTNAINHPLYVYLNNEKIPNINKEIWSKIDKKVGETIPENILDYIYAVLHSPTYREKYKEFLKTDFPKVPFPKDKKTFFELANLGEKLRNLHLMNDKSLEYFETKFNVVGDNVVEKIKYENGKVFINEKQYFENVPEVAWNFYIGGYQPAQKWLKDRKGRFLGYEDILHYQKIVKVLVETSKIMEEIEKVEFV